MYLNVMLSTDSQAHTTVLIVMSDTECLETSPNVVECHVEHVLASKIVYFHK